MMEQRRAGDVLEDHGLDSGAHRRRPVGRRLPTASATRRRFCVDAIAKDRVLLSLAHNMAQPNGITAAMIDVMTEYVHNSAIPAAEGQKPLAAAVRRRVVARGADADRRHAARARRQAAGQGAAEFGAAGSLAPRRAGDLAAAR